MSLCNTFLLRAAPNGGMQPDQGELIHVGPRLQCQVRLDVKRAEALRSLGHPIPAGTDGEILVDTGASMTCVDEHVLIALGAPRIGTAEVRTPQGQESQGVYMCGLGFPGTNLPSPPMIPVLGSKLNSQGIIGLMGRDVLATGLLVYNGAGGTWTLAF